MDSPAHWYIVKVGFCKKNWLFDLIHVITRHISGSMLWKHQIRVFIVKTEQTERICRNLNWHRYCVELLLPFMTLLWCFRRDCAAIVLIIRFWDNTFSFYKWCINKLLFTRDTTYYLCIRPFHINVLDSFELFKSVV